MSEPGPLELCQQCYEPDETFTRYADADDVPDGYRLLDAEALHVCDGCGFYVREYDGGLEW